MTSLNPKISIITPIFNGQDHLERCIDSIIIAASKCDDKNIELILIDDGSTDKSAEIAQKYAQRTNWINYVYQTNKGASGARNKGLRLARGDYISFVDCDDSVSPTYFTELLKVCGENPDIIVFGYERKLINGQTNSFSPKSKRHEGSQSLLTHVNEDRELFWFVWTKAFRRGVLRQINFNEKISLGEDTIFNLQAVCNSQLIIRISNVLYSYYETPGSLSSSSYKSALLENMEEHFSSRLLVHKGFDNNLNDSIRLDISKYYLGHIVPWLLSNTMKLEKKRQLQELKRIRESDFVKTCFSWKSKVTWSRGQALLLFLFRFRMLNILRIVLTRI